MKGFFEHSTKFILMGASLLASACANGPANSYYTTDANKSAVSSLTSGGLESSACSVNNILPINDTHMNGSDRWTVCPDSTTPTTLSISGFTADSNQICVFPAQSTDIGVVAIKNVTIQCPIVVESGMVVSYPKITFNAAFIVASKYSAQMYQCLTVGGPCPPHSYGQFR